MEGFLDERNAAFLTLNIGEDLLDFHIDTGFDGTLVVGEELFDSRRATPAGHVEAELAAGRHAVFQSFFVEFDWHGETVRSQVLVGPGKECLLGTELLNPHRLEIDYGERTVHLECNPDW